MLASFPVLASFNCPQTVSCESSLISSCHATDDSTTYKPVWLGMGQLTAHVKYSLFFVDSMQLNVTGRWHTQCHYQDPNGTVDLVFTSNLPIKYDLNLVNMWNTKNPIAMCHSSDADACPLELFDTHD